MAAKKQVVAFVPEYVACCFVGCPVSAQLRRLTKTGWANLCDRHDHQITQEAAEETCRKLGLDTPAKQREWVLKHLKIPLIARRIREREPGEDDESIRGTEIAI